MPTKRSSLLGRLFGKKGRDPMWDHFISKLPADPNGDLVPALTGASEGRVFPVKGNDPDPEVMSQRIKDLARWWGADLVGIVPLEGGEAVGDAELHSQENEPGQDDEAAPARYRYAILFALFSDYDPEEARGIGGQYVLQRGAVVVQHMGAYIREIGFQATKSQLDPGPLAEAAGLGRLDRQGRLKVSGQRRHVHVPPAVVTDLPMAVDSPALEAGQGQRKV